MDNDIFPDSCPNEVLRLVEDQLDFSPITIENAPSAQQQVFILTFPPSCNPKDSTWKQALHRGNYRLVVRVWRGTSRWWTLNRHDESELPSMAASEVAGYRLARRALASTRIQIPTILEFQRNSNWAILEYVGKESKYFEQFPFDSSWTDQMIKVRFEYGFQEPHPRWGRVPVSASTEYALAILRQVMIPIHRYFMEERDHTDDNENLYGYREDGRGLVYGNMVKLLRTSYERMRTLNDGNDKRIRNSLSHLDQAIDRLEKYELDLLPSVICHMDLQPQNLMFAQHTDGVKIATVLDWEEAAYADPRFDLLLLCRKVCANQEQARILWETYSNEMSLQLGPLDPWLDLETTHSITTLLLQSMDLLGGGRSPWETKPDLWGKMEREFARLSNANGRTS